MVSETVYPAVAYAIAELFFLSPQHLLRQVGIVHHIKCFSEDVLLHLLVLAIWEVLHVYLQSKWHPNEATEEFLGFIFEEFFK